MDDKNTNKKQENQRANHNEKKNQNHIVNQVFTMRDDHCDWGSSGME